MCPSGEGLQYYFIGPDDARSGPVLSSIAALAELHPAGSANVELYRGQNPMTSKEVRIDYLPDESLLRISTYYEDTTTSTDKPYVFTVDEDREVTHLSW